MEVLQEGDGSRWEGGFLKVSPGAGKYFQVGEEVEVRWVGTDGKVSGDGGWGRWEPTGPKFGRRRREVERRGLGT